MRRWGNRISPPKLILVPTDFSEPAAHALRYASALGERLGAHLLVFDRIHGLTALRRLLVGSVTEAPVVWILREPQLFGIVVRDAGPFTKTIEVFLIGKRRSVFHILRRLRFRVDDHPVRVTRVTATGAAGHPPMVIAGLWWTGRGRTTDVSRSSRSDR